LSHTHAYELELALAAKQKALEECSTMIDSAVEELRSMAEAGEQFWEHVRALKNGTRGKGQWAVLPKPDFGRTMVEREQAKDVIIPYAVDEGEVIRRCAKCAYSVPAPPALRARCLAAFDLDPSKKESLQFGARSCLRLRVTCSDGMTSSLSTLVHLTADDSDVQGMMEAAQLEAFDEDLFNEVILSASNGA
jgi:hypothetical protein